MEPLLRIGLQFPVQLGIVIMLRVQNVYYFRQGPDGDEEGEWGVGQVLAIGMLLVNSLACAKGYFGTLHVLVPWVVHMGWNSNQ